MEFPFIYGAQYYRAPTPDEIYWEEDLKRISESGITDVKFWAQWRYANRSCGKYYFEDLDILMDLASKYNLRVTINVITDVCPSWVYKTYPDSKMITASGRVFEGVEASCRQIGGYPGPCYNHKEAFNIRMDFIKEVVTRYANHPAMGMWDMWNEPETNYKLRTPKAEDLVCYCDNCYSAFINWLKNKYKSIDNLNKVWGRCYIDFDEIDLPRTGNTFSDMIDWRLFSIDVLANEAKERILLAKSIDKSHPVYLHPVPNILECFNSVTGVDDYLMSEHCDCFAGTTNGVPLYPLQSISSGKGKVCYNVESHLRYGSAVLYPNELELKDVATAFVPQIGLGIKGFLYWQYRPETLGDEAPHGGILDVDGSVGITHNSVCEFWNRLKPHADEILKAKVKEPEVAIFKSTSNDILSWCMYGNFDELIDNINGYTNLLYNKNVQITYVNEDLIKKGLKSSIKLLILPYVYGLDEDTATCIADWVEAGGVLICDAHTGAYNVDRGRVVFSVPGEGLAQRFGIREVRATAVFHLKNNFDNDFEVSLNNLSDDNKKAIKAFGLSGGPILPLKTEEGYELFGYSRYAELEGENIIPIATLSDRSRPCLGYKNLGNGKVFYFGTLLASTYSKGFNPNFSKLMDLVLEKSDINSQNYLPEGVRIDVLTSDSKEIYVITNLKDKEIEVDFSFDRKLTGLYSNRKIFKDRFVLEPKEADIFI